MSAALTVAVLAGGRSSEHDVSLASGAGVRAGLERAGHRVLDIRIGRDGVWRLGERELELAPGRGLLDADVAFPVLHGPYGEDGTIQGFLQILDVPHVGAGVAASALCLDKITFKELAAAVRLPQVRYAAVLHPRWRVDRERVLDELAALGLPVFVKPARQGSSLGIARVDEAEQLAVAIDAALVYDPRVIVEARALGVEVECGVLGNWEGDLRTSPPGQIIARGEWYDYEAKYSDGGMELVLPARISAGAGERVQALARAAFAHAGCDGMARVDFFVEGEEVLVNELNTIPGFTPTSVYAKLFEAAGTNYDELVDALCRLALARSERERAYAY